ncbi:hypothetical protein [Campylobacter rectus]
MRRSRCQGLGFGGHHAFWPNAKFSVGRSYALKIKPSTGTTSAKGGKRRDRAQNLLWLRRVALDGEAAYSPFCVARDVAEFIEKSLYFFKFRSI